MQACENKWLDVFVTKSDYGFDDTEVCEVQSVELTTAAGVTNKVAVVVDAATEWIIPTWSHDLRNVSNAEFEAIKVGDLIRVGSPKEKAFTDYLTVLEIERVDRVYNGTSGKLPIRAGTATGELDANTTNNSNVSNTYLDLASETGIARYAIRVNNTLNCTAVPDGARLASQVFNGSAAAVTIATRYDVLTNHYKLYRLNHYLSGSTLTANLDSGVKYVNCIKLLGYSVAAKRQVGVQHGHEMSADDYLIVRIKEVQGKVVSNNSHANGAFAILYAGATDNNNIGGIEFHRFDAENGIAVQSMQPTILRNLTLEVLDRFGNPAHFGRLHLWFKLLATHG